MSGHPRRGIAAAAALALLLAAVAAGCGGGGSKSGSGGATTSASGAASGSPTAGVAGASKTLAGACKNTKVKKVAFFGFAAANSFAQATWKGVQQAAKKCGAQAKFFDPNFNAQTQVSQIQDATTTGQYQLFVVQANDGNAVVPVVKQALKAGITVVGEFTPIGTRYDTIQPQVPGLIFVGEAPVANGHKLGLLGIQACKGINPCNVVYMQGFKSLPLDNARTAEVLKTLKTAKNVHVVASPEGGYTQASGLKAAQDVLQAHSNVNVIIGSSQAVEGAQQAVKSVSNGSKIKLIGNGGSCQAVKGVLSGKWFAAYVLPEASSGATATELGIRAANGQKVSHSFNTNQLQNPMGTKQVLTSTHFKAQYCD